MGALGANLSLEVVLQIGISSLIGDALSMAIGDYLSSKGEMEYAIHEK
jgi:VIT1/CCC1 family predicted Fe2+/Mn2+ transporter